MNSEIKEKWVNALISGEYKQGTIKLWSNNKYCCLGVLCEVMKYKREPGISIYIQENNTVDSRLLTKDTLFKLEISKDHQCTLINMNETGATFNEIANFIEVNL